MATLVAKPNHHPGGFPLEGDDCKVLLNLAEPVSRPAFFIDRINRINRI
jgi:hypothetical protein